MPEPGLFDGVPAWACPSCGSTRVNHRCDGRQGAVEARDVALGQVAAHAEQHVPGFSIAAEAFIVHYLAGHGPSSGEAMTNACKAAGIVPHDDRAFGPVYLRLSRTRRIVKVGQVPRLKGHLTGGANVWALAS